MGRKVIAASAAACALLAPGLAEARPAPPPARPTDMEVDASSLASEGYWMVERDGTLHGFGLAMPLEVAPRTPAAPVGVPAVDVAANWAGTGAYVLYADGAVVHYGSAGADPIAAAAPAAGETAAALLPSPVGDGGWIVMSSGRIVASGTVESLGDLAGARLNAPIVDAAATALGEGYVLVAADGGVFTFGDVTFHGSLGGVRLNQPVVSVAVSPAGIGYALVAADGGVFTFGAAEFQGSTGGQRLNQPVVAVSPTLDGYRMVAADGGTFGFGDARFYGSLGSRPPDSPIVELSNVPTTPITAIVRFLGSAEQAGFVDEDFAFLRDAVEGEEPADDERSDEAAAASGPVLAVTTMLVLLNAGLTPEQVAAQLQDSVTSGELTAGDAQVLAWALATAAEARTTYGLRLTDLIS